MRTRLGLGAAAVAVALLSHASGWPAGVAAAAPLRAQAGFAADGGGVTLAQFGQREDAAAAPRPRYPGRPGAEGPDPGVVKPGDGGKGGDGKKGAKGAGKWNSDGGSRRGGGGGGSGFATGVGIGIGTAIIMGAGQCAAQSDRCTSRYGRGTSRYRRCMDDGGC